MRTAIDTNVLSAIWSKEASTPLLLRKLMRASADGALLVCPVVWAETHAHPGIDSDAVERFFASTGITVDFLLVPEVWREAAERFSIYAARRRRSKGDTPRRLLADFLVGAHALMRAERLLTLDEEMYRRNFPELTLL